MDLKSKLDLYKNQKQNSPSSKTKNKEKVFNKGNPLSREVALPGFIPRSNIYGRYWMRITCFPVEPDSAQKVKKWKVVNTALSREMKEEFLLLAKGLKDLEKINLHLEGMAFLDIETTGLRPGAGTVPFLIGFGYVYKKQFVIKQFFLENYIEERAVLQALGNFMKKIHTLVTYNGRLFDVPLLESRFVINSLPISLENIPNLDLLPVVRRIYKQKSKFFSLKKIEEQILGFFRKDDIPGKDIPAAYFAYQSRKQLQEMVDVLRHHQLDIISLSHLLLRIAQDASNRQDAQIMPSLLALSLRQRQWERAFALAQRLEHILESKTLMEDPGDLAFNIATAFKKKGVLDKALEIWLKRAQDDSRMALELSKYHEHKSKDFLQALHWAYVYYRHFKEKELTPEKEKQLMKRITRLEKKLEAWPAKE